MPALKLHLFQLADELRLASASNILGATDYDMRCLRSSVGILDRAVRRAGVPPGSQVRTCRCGCERFVRFVPLGSLEATGFVCADCGCPMEAAGFMEV